MRGSIFIAIKYNMIYNNIMNPLKRLGAVLVLIAFTIWIGYMVFIFWSVLTNKNNNKLDTTNVKDTVSTTINDTLDSRMHISD